LKIKIAILILILGLTACSKNKSEVNIPESLKGNWSYYKGFTGYGIKIDEKGNYSHSYYSLKFLKFQGFDGRILKVTSDEIHFKINGDNRKYIHKYRITEGKLYIANSNSQLLNIIKTGEQEYKKLNISFDASINPEGLSGSYSSSNEDSVNTVFITITKKGNFRVSVHYKQTNKIAKVVGRIVKFDRIKIDIMLGSSLLPVYFAQSERGKYLILGYSESDYLEAVDIYKRDSTQFIRGCHFFMKIS
jgi:hypothetical protein